MYQDRSMNTKKILFVSSLPIQYSFSANMRNIALIDGLCKCGYVVDVVCGEPSLNSDRYDKSLFVPQIRNIKYICKDVEVSNKNDDSQRKNKIGIKKILIKTAVKWYQKISIWDTRYIKVVRSKGCAIEDSYDIMISSSDPKSSHVLAHKIIKQNPGKIGKWIQYWGDPFTLDINQPTGSKKRIYNAERKLLALSDKVVYVSPLTLEQQKRLFKDLSSKMCFLPIPVRGKDNHEKNATNSSLTFGYFGAYFSRDRDVMPLYNAINNSFNILKIIGPTDISLKSTDRIIVDNNGRVPLSIIEQNEREVDVLVCIGNRTGTQIPGKAYHYAMTNKYILFILDGENAESIQNFYEQYQRYIFCRNNEESILEAISSIPKEISYHSPCKEFYPCEIAKKFIEIGEKEND